jgi:hypothetical protein
VAVLTLRDARTRARAWGRPPACALLRVRAGERMPRRLSVYRARGSSPNRSRQFPSHDVKQPRSIRSRGAFSAPGFCNFASLTPNRVVGGAPRNVRVQRHPLGLHMTRQARRLARRLASHNAGRSPLGAPPWRFWASGPRFRLLRRPPPYNGGHLPSGSVQRAPRTQVVVPGGRGPCLPGRTVTSRRRGTPLPAPPSGSSPETPLNERGCECSSTYSICSQE